MKKTKMMKKNYQFRKVLIKGTYYSGKDIEAFIKKNKRKDTNLLGIAIGVKIAKATKRNRIKRLIRESYRLNEEKIKTGNQIIFLWKKKRDPKTANFKNIEEDMKNILKKAEIIEEDT